MFSLSVPYKGAEVEKPGRNGEWQQQGCTVQYCGPSATAIHGWRWRFLSIGSFIRNA